MSRPRRQRGFTLAELLSAIVIMALVAMTMAALASAVQTSTEHQHGQGLAMQHGRVAMERIERALRTAKANEQFPGFFAFSDSLGGYTYPDALVIWQPESTPASPDGMPKMNELLVFKADTMQPGRLLELRAVGDTREAPALSNSKAWMMELEYLQSNPSASQVVLTDLVRVATATNLSGTSYGERGCVRFDVSLRPSASEWEEYKAGKRTWENVSWAQDLYGSTSGTRQAWCRIELQLRPADVESHDVAVAIPFFGSGAVYYQLEK